MHLKFLRIILSGLCRVIKVPSYLVLNSLYGTTGFDTETYLKNAHQWLNDNRQTERILSYTPYLLVLSPNFSGCGVFFTYDEENSYSFIRMFLCNGSSYKGEYLNGTWNFSQSG